ncbi:MAG: GAF domain-containing protein [Cyanobacteria bacterium P01_A01_bin.123]
MKFFKLNTSPTVQWIRRVVKGQPRERPVHHRQLQNPPQPSTSNGLTVQSQPEQITHSALNPLLETDQTSLSAFDQTLTPETPEMTMQKLQKSEYNLSPKSADDLSLNGNLVNDDWSVFDDNGFPETLPGHADLQGLLSTSQRMHQADTLETLLAVVVADVHQHLNIDRVLIYQFQTETQGSVVAELLAEGYTPSLNETLPAIAFGAQSPQEAQQQVVSINDVAQVSLSPHQEQIWAQFQTQSSLSVPILLDQVWGLIVVQQCTVPQPWQDADLALLYKIVTELRLGLQSLELRQEKLKAAQYEQELPAIIQKISDASYLENACQTAVQEVRELLDVERVAIYKFRPDYFGDFVYESESGGWPTLVGSAWEDTYIQENQGGRFRTGESYIADDVYDAGLSDCHIDILDYFGIKSFAIVAIKQGEKLWGLLSAFQHSGPRHWSGREVTLLAEVGRQLGATLQGTEYLAQLQEQSAQITQVARISHAVAEIIPEIRQSANLEAVFQTTKQSVRRLLKSDRVAIYQFQPDWSSQLVAEQTKKGLDTLEDARVGATWPKIDLQATQGGPYRNREHLVVNNIQTADFSAEQIEDLADFAVQAFLIAPIFKENKLWGLLGTYQDDEPRSWATVEINALTQIATQVGVAMQQVDYLEQTSNQMTKAAEQERLIDKIVDRIQRSTDLQRSLTTTCREIRRFLQTDRTAIYKFDVASDYRDGTTVAEDVEPGFLSSLDVSIRDHCFQENFVSEYERGRIWCISDIQHSGLEDCLVEILSNFQAKASLVVPLMKGDKLWGLFYNHQCRKPRDWQDSDIEFVKRIAAQLNTAIQKGEYIEELQRQSEQQLKVAEQERLINQIVERIRQSLDLQQAFNTTTREIRNFLKADRVAVFQFVPGSKYSQGKTIAENVRPGYVSALEVEVIDHCFSQGFADKYRRGHVSTFADINRSGIQQCYVDVLEQFQVQANLVVPLLRGEDLWGLFCIHQCEHPREWQADEIDFAKRIAAQLDIAIQQGEYVKQLQHQSVQLAEAAERDKAAKERLQQQVIQLLSAVRPALDGDLTVRAPVTESEVGTVADAYNNTLGSLRQIIVQMQAASSQVTQTTQTSESAIATLADQAQEQFKALATALEQLQVMAQTTQAVEVNARQVETAVQQANQTVLTGDAAIDRTVDEMQQIRGTVAETNKRLKRLGESSQKISKVVNLIGNFTTQTQLLALNASIEATRAGEYGRGFAVVADEVRSLARQSAEAATDIEELVQEIQANTSAVATAMEDGIQRVASGTTVVSEARQSLSAIVDATSQISQLVTGITQATQTQTQQCQSVTLTMRDVAEIANQTSEDSVNISTAFQTLLTTAQDLQTTSQQFRVN